MQRALVRLLKSGTATHDQVIEAARILSQIQKLAPKRKPRTVSAKQREGKSVDALLGSRKQPANPQTDHSPPADGMKDT